MAVLYVSEYVYLAQAAPGPSGYPLAAPAEPSVAEQNVPIGGSSTQSAAFNAQTTFVMINCDEACSVAFGTNPTAATTAKRLAANETRFFGVPAGKSYKVAVIANS